MGYLQVIFVLGDLLFEMFEVHFDLLLKFYVTADGRLKFLGLGFKCLVVEYADKVGL